MCSLSQMAIAIGAPKRWVAAGAKIAEKADALDIGYELLIEG